MEARHVIARRSDLSTFLVHLSRTSNGWSADERLRSIIEDWQLVAGSMFGSAKGRLDEVGTVVDSQKCVCFTETPLEYVHLLLQKIDNRQFEFEPYGVAFPKKMGRLIGVNPVWYVDISPGHDWLMRPINELIDQAIAAGGLDGNPIARLAPFIEQMGTNRDPNSKTYRKEFWWEREWRHVGNLDLPPRIILLCPEDEFPAFRQVIVDTPTAGDLTLVDPRWGLEQIISRLSGYRAEHSDIL